MKLVKRICWSSEIKEEKYLWRWWLIFIFYSISSSRYNILY